MLCLEAQLIRPQNDICGDDAVQQRGDLRQARRAGSNGDGARATCGARALAVDTRRSVRTEGDGRTCRNGTRPGVIASRAEASTLLGACSGNRAGLVIYRPQIMAVTVAADGTERLKGYEI